MDTICQQLHQTSSPTKTLPRSTSNPSKEMIFFLSWKLKNDPITGPKWNINTQDKHKHHVGVALLK